MKGQKTEKRNVRTYKVTDAIYDKAKKKAKAQKTTVAAKVENLLYDYITR